MNGFYFEHAQSHEVRTLHLYAMKHNYEVRWHKYNKQCDDLIPYGDVDWFFKLTGWTIIPDYYPEFLSSYVKRNVWQADKWPLKKVFIKPSDKYKRFTGFVTNGTYKGKKRGPYWCSDIVEFKNEWRYYVADGEVLSAKWYLGSDEDKEAPVLDIDWPKDYCGAVDFGEVGDGIELIEAHHPFCMGWYGSTSDNEKYGQWVVKGWEYMRSKYGRVD